MTRNTDNDEEEDEDADDQSTFDDFTGTSKSGETWQCRVCGFESEEEGLVDNCHPDERLERERRSAVTDATDSHTGFVYPAQLYPEVREFLTDVEAAIQAAGESNVLATATDVIEDHLSGNTFQSHTIPDSQFQLHAFQAFLYLVFLQQYWVLPGYPTAVSTRGESLSEIQEFCRENDRFRGDVTDKMIENSDLITRERVYRAKVFSTTDDFAYQSQILPNWSRWQWTTQWGIDTEELLTNVIFDEGAAHNAVVARSRNWLETHPTIDWACAPHVMGAPVGEQAESRFSPLSPNSDPPEGPVWMFDFAGFEERQYPRLAVVGFVIDDESDTEIMEQIARAAQISIPTVLVFPRRPAIIDFIDTVYSRGWLDSDAVSLDDVTEYYRSHPSIPAINATFSDQLGIENLRFVSRKQIIDDVIDPGDVFPQRVLRGDE